MAQIEESQLCRDVVPSWEAVVHRRVISVHEAVATTLAILSLHVAVEAPPEATNSVKEIVSNR